MQVLFVLAKFRKTFRDPGAQIRESTILIMLRLRQNSLLQYEDFTFILKDFI